MKSSRTAGEISDAQSESMKDTAAVKRENTTQTAEDVAAGKSGEKQEE